ncbi:sugar ABC transporter permease [Kribbella solani]|uniref:carbohydrate ABC transporter permease n=1 Tax=Kribbella solani TaxID=236067 RepID=UPI0029AB22A2|nr:sugar ABC transporter permease [Kribbella solani]MDX2971295.1 sugar ABC transporter permease [Kribbella solani]MDX3005558.1 sugar ABC transporter permease [Kribbella solani]
MTTMIRERTGRSTVKPPNRQGSGWSTALMLSPTLLTLALVVGYPVLAAVRLAFVQVADQVNPQTGMLERTESFGLGNFAGIFTGESSEAFRNAFWNTTLFTVIGVTAEVVLGVAMALVMNRAIRARGLVRVSVLVPWAIPTAISGLLWRWVFESDGIANAVLHTQVVWTADDSTIFGFISAPFTTVLIADIWKTAPFIGLLVLAGLQIIPKEVYEAAKIDRAGTWATFWRITIPLVKPTLVVAVLFRILDALKMFDLPFVLVGAHKHSVETLSTLAQYEMSNVRYGPAAAYSTVLFLYIALIAFLFVKVLGADLIGRGLKESR